MDTLAEVHVVKKGSKGKYAHLMPDDDSFKIRRVVANKPYNG